MAMAAVAQRLSLFFPLRKPEVRCSAHGDGFSKLPESRTSAKLKAAPSELKLQAQREEVRIEIEGKVRKAGFVEDLAEKLKESSPGELVFYGALTGAGFALGGAALSSFEVLPLVPEVLQAIGLGYSILVAGRALRGDSDILVATSPFKAIVELLDGGIQRTTVVLPVDMDEAVVQAMQSLAKERDNAVNRVEEMKKAASGYARVVAEKEALEAVAMELVKERDTAISEVSGLKKAVEAMQGRIASIEQVLAQEVQTFKQQNEALEALAMQLATERDTALEEVTKLKELASKTERTEAEKLSLEEVALQLAQERDTALAEVGELRKVIERLHSAESAEQETLTRESQFIDIAHPYDNQKKEDSHIWSNNPERGL